MNTLHGSKISNRGFDQVMSILSDHLITNFTFNLRLTITIIAWKDWVEPLKSIFFRGGLFWFMDGSKTERGEYAGVNGVRPKLSMLQYFPTETYALFLCGEYNLQMRYCNQQVNIYSDSQAELKALASCWFDSELVWHCRKSTVLVERTQKLH